MKRALAATLFGGLLICGISQAAFADGESADHPPASAAPADGHDSAGQPAEKPAAPEGSGERKQDPPGEGNSHYDKLHHDGDGF